MQLVAVSAELPLAVVTADESDTGVVDQHVEPRVVAENRGGEFAHLCEGSEVGRVEPRAALAGAVDRRDHRRAALAVPPVDDHVCAAGGNAHRDFASESVGRFEGGVWWVELATIGDPASVPSAVVAAIGAPAQLDRRPVEVICDQTHGRATLLVLDNCEHVIAATAWLVDELLTKSHTLTVLATSREPLSVPGEIVWRVPSLGLPDHFGHNWDALEECLADLDWLPASGYVVMIADAEQVLTKPDDEDDYETFIEILAEAGEAWSTKRSDSSTGAGIPFHTVLLVSDRQKHKRRNWLVPMLSTEKAAVGEHKTTKPAKARGRS